MSLLSRLMCAIGWHEWVCYDVEPIQDSNVWKYRCMYCDSERESRSEFFD